MAGLYSHTTRADGLILTAAIYNSDHQNHIDNHNPQQLNDYSDSVAQMRSQTDPGEVGTESLATNTSGELERIRNVLKEIIGKTYWYESPDNNVSSTFSFRNLFINGAHQIDQRSADTRTGLGAADIYLTDRWQLDLAGSASARWTASRETTGGPFTSGAWLKLLCTNMDNSPSAAESHSIRQYIEGQNCRPIIASDGSILAHVVSFRIIAHADGASSITFPAKVGVAIRTLDGTARQYVTDVTVTADATWERGSVVVPVDATGSIDNDNGKGLEVSLALYGGTSQQGTDAVWENDNDGRLTSSSDNWADATNNYIGFTEAQLEVGVVATEFEHRPIGIEDFLCDRYFQRYNYANNKDIVSTGHCATTIVLDTHFPLRTVMRDAPILVAVAAEFDIYHQNTRTALTGISLDTTGNPHSVLLRASDSGAGLTAGEGASITCDSTGNRNIDLNAEF